MIIAIKDIGKDRVVVGYTNRDLFNRMAVEDYCDIENIPLKFGDNGALYAFTVESGEADALLYDDEFYKKEVSHKAIVKDIIPFMKKKFEDRVFGYEPDGKWHNELIICDKNRLYEMTMDYNVTEVQDYTVQGIYRSICTAILEDIKDLPAEERIIKAFSVLGKINQSNLFPIAVADTQKKEIRVVQKGVE